MIMKQYGVRTPAGSVASTPDEAEKIAEALGMIFILFYYKIIIIF